MTTTETPTPAEMVAEFHRAFGHPIAYVPTRPDPDAVNLRATLLAEEAAELAEAYREGELVDIAGEAADLAYVVHGTALAFGLQVEPLSREMPSLAEGVERFRVAATEGTYGDVRMALCALLHEAYDHAADYGIYDYDLDAVIAAKHVANMAKLGADGKPILRADGKVLKPAGWLPADVSAVLVAQGVLRVAS